MCGTIRGWMAPTSAAASSLTAANVFESIWKNRKQGWASWRRCYVQIQGLPRRKSTIVDTLKVNFVPVNKRVLLKQAYVTIRTGPKTGWNVADTWSNSTWVTRQRRLHYFDATHWLYQIRSLPNRTRGQASTKKLTWCWSDQTKAKGNSVHLPCTISGQEPSVPVGITQKDNVLTQRYRGSILSRFEASVGCKSDSHGGRLTSKAHTRIHRSRTPQ